MTLQKTVIIIMHPFRNPKFPVLSIIKKQNYYTPIC